MELDYTVHEHLNATVDPQSQSWLTPINCNGLNSIPGFVKDNIRYDISTDGDYSYETARSYCLSRGGDMAVTGMSSLALRE